MQRYQKAGLEGLASGHHSTRLAAENRRLRANNLELEMELAVQQKYQQICWRGDQLPDFSGVQREAAYQTVKELHEAHHWPVYKLCSAAGVSRAGFINGSAERQTRSSWKMKGWRI